MKKFHYFKNYVYQFSKDAAFGDSVLNALCSFQFHHATTEKAVFSVILENSDGDAIGFAQEYQKTTPGRAYHGAMFRHAIDAYDCALQAKTGIPDYFKLLVSVPEHAKL